MAAPDAVPAALIARATAVAKPHRTGPGGASAVRRVRHHRRPSALRQPSAEIETRCEPNLEHANQESRYRESVDAPRTRPVDARAYLGPNEPDSPCSIWQRVRPWLERMLAVALGIAAAELNLTSWLLGAGAIGLVSIVVVDQYKRHVRRLPSN